MELLLNGKSIGVQKNNRQDKRRRNSIFWKNVPYGKGGKITAIARNAGKEVARHQLETTGEPKKLIAEIENTDWKADGMDLQYLRVYAVDSRGRVVPTATNELTFEVSGEATITATDNGDHFTDNLFINKNRKLHQGFAMVILRSTQTAGKVKVKVSSKELKGVEKELLTK